MIDNLLMVKSEYGVESNGIVGITAKDSSVPIVEIFVMLKKSKIYFESPKKG